MKAAARSRAGKARTRHIREEAEAAKVISLRVWASGGDAR
jgi:hypothetical protein